MNVKQQKTVKAMREAIKSVDAKKTHPFDSSATVVRVDGNTAWVHFEGGAEETPVKKTINAKKGDVVQVRVSGGNAWLVGNATAPPTDDALATEVSKELIITNTIVTENIQATNARFENVEADTAKIHHLEADEIEASVGYIADLTADNITAQNIIADHATVDNLDATYATIQSLDAEKARITNLQATKADITALNAEKARIDTLEANEAVINDTLKATNAHVEYLESDWISTDRLVLTGNNKNNYPPVEITESEFNANKTAYYTKSGDTYTQCTTSSVYDADTQYYVKQTVQSIIEAINTANNTDPQIVVSNDKLIAASMDVAELSAITANMGTLTAGKIQKGNNFINLNTSPASMEFKNASTWANATQGLQFDTQGNLSIKGTVNVSGGNVYTKTETEGLIDDIEVGGRNLLLKSNVAVSNTAYGMHDYYFPTGHEPVEGETYTIQLKGTLGSGKTQFGIYNSGGYVDECVLTSAYLKNGIYTRTFTWKITGGGTTASNTYLRVYQMPQSVTATSTIEWIKLEKGDKPTDWTPAPEDVESDINDARKTATNYLTTISGTSGISVHDANNTSNYVNINSSAVNVVQGGTNVAQFGASTRIGVASSAHIELGATNGMNVFDQDNKLRLNASSTGISIFEYDSNDNRVNVAQFGSTARIGTATGNRITISPTYLQVFNSSNVRNALFGDYAQMGVWGESGCVTVNYPVNATTPNGIQIWNSSRVSIMQLSDSTIRVGAENASHTNITTSGMEVFKKESGDSSPVSVASFGSTVRVGAIANSQSRTLIQPSGIDFITRNSSGTDVNLAHIGYDNAKDSAGSTSNKHPFYTFGTRASGTYGAYSMSSGYANLASGYASHAEGAETTASGTASHTEGAGTKAIGGNSHAEGYLTTASGEYSHASGIGTTASYDGMTAIGKYNGLGNYAFVIGCGTSNSNRLNALSVDWSGNLAVSESIVCGGNLVASGTISGASGWSGNLVVGGSVTLHNGSGLNSYASDGTTVKTIAYMTTSNDYIFGSSCYNDQSGTVSYRGNNITVWSRGSVFIVAPSGITNSGTYNALYKVTSMDVSVAQGEANTTVSSTTYTIPTASRVSGYKAVGIVGVTNDSYNIEPFNYHVTSDTQITAGFIRRGKTTQSYDTRFYILWLKATSA